MKKDKPNNHITKRMAKALLEFRLNNGFSSKAMFVLGRDEYIEFSNWVRWEEFPGEYIDQSSMGKVRVEGLPVLSSKYQHGIEVVKESSKKECIASFRY